MDYYEAKVLWPGEKDWVPLHGGVTSMPNAIGVIEAALENGAASVRIDTYVGSVEDLVVWRPVWPWSLTKRLSFTRPCS